MITDNNNDGVGDEGDKDAKDMAFDRDENKADCHKSRALSNQRPMD